MDIATLIGVFASVLIIISAIMIDSSLFDFVNVPGLTIVVVGTMTVTLIKFRLGSVVSSFKLAFSTVLRERTEHPLMLVQSVRDLAAIVRREGILGLEKAEVENEFLKKSISMCVDGHSPEFIEEVMVQEIELCVERYSNAERVFRGIAETAPGLGMLGTLVGLVQMLNTLSDPGSIGPAMAVALLTTFYGAFIAQVLAIPMADKIFHKSQDEHRNMSLVVTSVQNILRGQNPRVISDVLSIYLPPEQRNQLDEEAAL